MTQPGAEAAGAAAPAPDVVMLHVYETDGWTLQPFTIPQVVRQMGTTAEDLELDGIGTPELLRAYALGARAMQKALSGQRPVQPEAAPAAHVAAETTDTFEGKPSGLLLSFPVALDDAQAGKTGGKGYVNAMGDVLFSRMEDQPGPGGAVTKADRVDAVILSGKVAQEARVVETSGKFGTKSTYREVLSFAGVPVTPEHGDNTYSAYAGVRPPEGVADRQAVAISYLAQLPAGDFMQLHAIAPAGFANRLMDEVRGDPLAMRPVVVMFFDQEMAALAAQIEQLDPAANKAARADLIVQYRDLEASKRKFVHHICGFFDTNVQADRSLAITVTDIAGKENGITPIAFPEPAKP
jgi:hypothetical protein